MVSSILVGVEDSDGAATALRWTDRFVDGERQRGRGVAAVAVSAWSPPALALAGGLAPAEGWDRAAAEALDRQLAQLPDPDRFERAVIAGPPADVLIDEAARRDVDLVVVGRRGRSALAQILLGSVSRSVAAQAERPVAVVPPGAEWSTDPIVVGYDGSPGSEAALRWALEHTNGPIIALSAWHLPTDAIYDPAAVDVDGFEDRVRRGLADAIAALPANGAERVTPIVQRDDPRLALVAQAKEAAAVVLGARANRGVRGLLLGSTVDYVAAHAEQAVIVVPPPHDDG